MSGQEKKDGGGAVMMILLIAVGFVAGMGVALGPSSIVIVNGEKGEVLSTTYKGKVYVLSELKK